MAAKRAAQTLEDHDLLGLIAKGDQVALQELYVRFEVPLFRFLSRMLRNEALAEELVNETFLEIWRAAANFEGRSQPSSWMFGIARNKALSVMRKRSEYTLDDEMAEKISDDADTPEQAAMKGSKAERIRQCLEKLKPNHREIVELVYYQEKTIKEVSDIIGIPENTVKTRMFHARKQLTTVMQQAGIDRGWP